MYEPTSLEMLVAEVKGNGESEYKGLFKQIPLRLKCLSLLVLKHFMK